MSFTIGSTHDSMLPQDEGSGVTKKGNTQNPYQGEDRKNLPFKTCPLIHGGK